MKTCLLLLTITLATLAYAKPWNYNYGPVNIQNPYGNQFNIPTYNYQNYGNVNYGQTNIYGVTGSHIGIGKRRKRSTEDYDEDEDLYANERFFETIYRHLKTFFQLSCTPRCL